MKSLKTLSDNIIVNYESEQFSGKLIPISAGIHLHGYPYWERDRIGRTVNYCDPSVGFLKKEGYDVDILTGWHELQDGDTVDINLIPHLIFEVVRRLHYSTYTELIS